MSTGFTGFPEAALDFYDDLELDNSKSFWEAHKHLYDEAVRRPMLALTAELAEEFGPAKVFRPYRDVRFGKDKTPYKNHQGAIVQVGPATGYYVQIGSPGVLVGGGYHHTGGPDLSRIRAAVALGSSGEELRRILAELSRQHFEMRGEQLKTKPRGYRADHPRIELLRYTSLSMTKSYGFENLDTPGLADRVRGDWRAVRPMVEWIQKSMSARGV